MHWCIGTDDGTKLIPTWIAAAAITDHLDTRSIIVQGNDAVWGKSPNIMYEPLGGDRPWAVSPLWGATLFASKLSAQLSAHIIRLDLPRTLIENTEK
jgi:hypothetical protein